jgi:hypothetical protein
LAGPLPKSFPSFTVLWNYFPVPAKAHSENSEFTMKITFAAVMMFVAAFFCAARVNGQIYIPTNDPPYYGPYNGSFWAGGDELKKHLVKSDTLMRGFAVVSCMRGYGWRRSRKARTDCRRWKSGRGIFTVFGSGWRELFYWGRKDATVSGAAGLTRGKWQFVAATFDGQEVQIYANGAKLAGGKLDAGRVSPLLVIAPAQFPAQDNRHFAGKIAGLTVLRHAMTGEELKEMYAKPLNFTTVVYEEGSKPWPVQTQAQAGCAPQDPDTMPRSKAGYSRLEKKSCANRSWGLRRRVRMMDDFRAVELRPAPEISAQRRDFAKRICDQWLVGCDGAGNSADNDDQSGRLSRPGLRAEQSGNSGKLEQAGLLVSKRVHRTSGLEGAAADADI